MTDSTDSNENLPAVWQPRTLQIAGKPVTNLLPDVTVLGDTTEVVSAENVDMDDLVMPELRLTQSMSEQAQSQQAKPGQYYLTSTGEVFDPPVQVLLIHHSKGRALFPNPGKGSGHLERCLSTDCVTGTTYGDCATCPHKEWPTEEQKATNPSLKSPPCSLQHNFVVMTHSGPAVVRFGRTSKKAAQKFLTGFSFSRRELWHNVCLLTVKQKTDPGTGSSYYTHELLWDPQDQVPDEMRQGALTLFHQLKELHEAAKLNVIGEDHEDQ